MSPSVKPVSGPVPWKSQPQSNSCTIPHALLDQPPREQAIVGEAALRPAGRRRPSSVSCVSLVDVHDLGHRGLHAKGKFVLGDARQRFRMPQFVRPAIR